MKRDLTFAAALLGLLLLGAGCLSFEHTSAQTFASDGSSTFSLDMQIGVSKTGMAMLQSSAGSGGQAAYQGAALKAMMNALFLSMEQAMCDQAGHVQSCTVDESAGRLHLDAAMEAGEFYTVQSVKDEEAGVENITYTISKVPTYAYYSGYGQEPKAYSEALQKSMQERFKANLRAGLEEALTEDYYCSSNTPFPCEVASSEKGKERIKLALPQDSSGASTGPDKILWAGCSDKNISEATMLGETRMKSLVTQRMDIDKAVPSGGIELAANCPARMPNLLVVSQYSGKSGGSIMMTSSYGVVPKEAIISELEKQMNSSTGSAASATGSALPYEQQVINLKAGRFTNKTYEEGVESFSSGIMSVNYTITYKAEFPQKVLSAKIGSRDVPVSGNAVEISLDDLAEYGAGELVVLTQKELPKPEPAPAAAASNEQGGDMTMMVVGGVVVLLIIIAAAFVLVRKPKEPGGMEGSDMPSGQPPAGVPPQPPQASGDADGMPMEEAEPQDRPPASGPAFPPHRPM